MDDLIRRQDVIDYVLEHGFYCDTEADKEYTAELIRTEFPSAQQWIPCSERLPNYDEEVLVDYHGKVRLASLTKNDEEYPWYFIVNRFNAKLETVRAWMPLPDCYQGGEVI